MWIGKKVQAMLWQAYPALDHTLPWRLSLQRTKASKESAAVGVRIGSDGDPNLGWSDAVGTFMRLQ